MIQGKKTSCAVPVAFQKPAIRDPRVAWVHADMMQAATT